MATTYYDVYGGVRLNVTQTTVSQDTPNNRSYVRMQAYLTTAVGTVSYCTTHFDGDTVSYNLPSGSASIRDAYQWVYHDAQGDRNVATGASASIYIQSEAAWHDFSVNFSVDLPQLDQAPAVVVPDIATWAITNLGITTATGNAYLVSSSDTIIEKGICYSTSANPTISNSIVWAANVLGLSSCNITGLTPNTTYHYRAFSTNSAGRAYGSDVAFLTFANPAVTSSDATNIAVNSVTMNGNLTDNGNPDITEKGFCYGASANPTITDTKATITGTAIGAYSKSVTGLTSSTTYHYRAYAINTNSSGTVYGADKSFTTDNNYFTNPTNAYSSNNSYATAASDSGLISIKVSKDGGTTWSAVKTNTYTSSEGYQTFGGNTDTWGLTLTGADLNSATNFVIRVMTGISNIHLQDYKGFGYAETEALVVTGLKIEIEAKYASSTVSIDHLRVTPTMSSTNTDIVVGSTTYDSTLQTLTANNGAAWIPMSPWVNPYKFRVYRDAAYTGIADATLTVVDFDAESFDTNSNFDLTTDKYTIPVTGYYNLSFSVRASGTAMIALSAYIYGGAAGNTVLVSTYATQASTTDGYVCVSGLFYCVKDDLINARIYADTTGTYAILAGTESTYFSGYLVSV